MDNIQELLAKALLEKYSGLDWQAAQREAERMLKKS